MIHILLNEFAPIDWSQLFILAVLTRRDFHSSALVLSD